VLWIEHLRQALNSVRSLNWGIRPRVRLEKTCHDESTARLPSTADMPAYGQAPPVSANKRRLQKLFLTAAFAADRMAAQHAGILHTAAQIVPGRWDLAGLCGRGSFDWALSDVFLPDRRTMPQSASL
jgi:hypothetical protein